MVQPVPRVRRLQAFFPEHQQGFMQGVEQIDRRRMVIGAFTAAAPIAHNQLHIEKPALYLVAAVLNALYRTRAEGHGRQAGYAGQTLLGAGVHGIGSPGIDLQFNTAEAGDGIDNAQCAVFPCQGTECGDITACARRGLGVHESQQRGFRVGGKRGCNLVQADGLSPVVLDHDRGRPAALDVFLHAAAKNAVAADDDRITGRHQVDETSLHARGAGCRNRQCQRVVCLKGVLQQAFHIVHQVDEKRVEVAYRGPAQGAQYAWRHVGRAGAH